MSTMASDNFLDLDKVLDYNVYDVFTYLEYLDAKVRAEKAQIEFDNKLNK